MGPHARYCIPVHERLTVDVGARVGYETGDLPAHRRFFLGRAHPSAVFVTTHALFLGKVWGDRHDPRLSVSVGRQF